MDKFDILMNPIRQRIFQYLIINDEGTVKDIKKSMPDVPNASLYRHIKMLEDNGIITAVRQKQVKAVKENVYVVNREELITDDKDGNAVRLVLMKLYADFSKYYADEKHDPIKDMLSATTGTLTLSDEKFAEYLEEIYKITIKYMEEEVKEDSKVRQITFISAPVEKNSEE